MQIKRLNESLAVFRARPAETALDERKRGPELTDACTQTARADLVDAMSRCGRRHLCLLCFRQPIADVTFPSALSQQRRFPSRARKHTFAHGRSSAA